MRSLSKLIKNDNVLNGSPFEIKWEPKPAGSKETNSNYMKAEEVAKIIIDNANQKAHQINKHAKLEAKEVYEQARSDAAEKGYVKGLLEGERAAHGKLEETQSEQERQLEQLNIQLQEEYQKALESIREDALNFAFGLAQKILGIKIDRNDQEILSVLQQNLIEIQEKPALEGPRDITGQNQDTVTSISISDHTDCASENSVSDGTLHDVLLIDNRKQDEEEDPPFRFEDILLLKKDDLQHLMRNLNMKDMVVALKGADSKIAETIIDCIPKRLQSTIKEELDFLGPMRLSDVERAQKQVVKTIRRLAKAGEILFEVKRDDLLVQNY